MKVQVTNEEQKGTVVIEEKDDGSREVWITGQDNMGDITVFTNSDGKLDKVRVTGEKGKSATTEYLHQLDGRLKPVDSN